MAVICGMPAPVTMRVVQMEPGPMPTLTASAPASISAMRAVVGGDVAGEQVDLREALLALADGFEHARGVAMRGVDGERVDAHFDQLGGALQEVAGGADGAGHAQAALVVLAGVGILQLLLDVFDGDQAFELVVVVDDQQLFDAVLVEDLFGLLRAWCRRGR